MKNDVQDIDHVERITEPQNQQESDNVTQLADRLFAAQQSTETETNMSVWEALKLYPMASMWSILISFAVVMEGKIF